MLVNKISYFTYLVGPVHLCIGDIWTGELNDEKKLSKQRIKGKETKVLRWEEVCLFGGRGEQFGRQPEWLERAEVGDI